MEHRGRRGNQEYSADVCPTGSPHYFHPSSRQLDAPTDGWSRRSFEQSGHRKHNQQDMAQDGQ